MGFKPPHRMEQDRKRTDARRQGPTKLQTANLRWTGKPRHARTRGTFLDSQSQSGQPECGHHSNRRTLRNRSHSMQTRRRLHAPMIGKTIHRRRTKVRGRTPERPTATLRFSLRQAPPPIQAPRRRRPSPTPLNGSKQATAAYSIFSTSLFTSASIPTLRSRGMPASRFLRGHFSLWSANGWPDAGCATIRCGHYWPRSTEAMQTSPSSTSNRTRQLRCRKPCNRTLERKNGMPRGSPTPGPPGSTN